MTTTGPTDVDVTVGYPDGTLRTYVMRGVVVAPDMKIMNIKTHMDSASPAPPAVMPTAPAPLLDTTVIAANAFVWIGVGSLLNHWGGPGALIGLGIVLLWWRQIWLRAQRVQHGSRS